MVFKFCSGLLECGSWFTGDCIYELELFHTACTIFKFHGCLHFDTRLRPVKEQAGTELNLIKLNTHVTNLEHWLQHQRHFLGYLTTQSSRH